MNAIQRLQMIEVSYNKLRRAMRLCRADLVRFSNGQRHTGDYLTSLRALDRATGKAVKKS
jgi:hypothetical protein